MFISPLLIVKYDDAVKEMWCKDTKPIEGRNGCMSDKHCLENARGQCDQNPTCFGVSWFPHVKHQKLKLCTSREMVPKRRPFLWRTMMKVEGNCSFCLKRKHIFNKCIKLSLLIQIWQS